MKKPLMLIVLYCVVHAASGDFGVKYEGLDKKAIAKLIPQTYNGAKFDFVDQKTFDAFSSKHRPRSFTQPSTPSQSISQK